MRRTEQFLLALRFELIGARDDRECGLHAAHLHDQASLALGDQRSAINAGAAVPKCVAILALKHQQHTAAFDACCRINVAKPAYRG